MLISKIKSMVNRVSSGHDGWGFGFSAAVPGLLTMGAATLGGLAAVIIAGVASFAGAVVKVATAAAGGAAGFAGLAGVAAAGAGGVAAATGMVGYAVAAGLVGVGLATSVAVGMAAGDDSKKYNPKKIVRGTLAGAALSAVLSGMAVDTLQKSHAAESLPSAPHSHTHAHAHMESRGGELCADFRLTNGPIATAVVNEKDGKIRTMTTMAPRCALN